MSPMGDAERLSLSAQYELRRGATPEQAAQRLRVRFGWLSPGEAADVVGGAMDALDRGRELNSGQDNMTIGAEQRPGEPGRGVVNVDASVVIDVPGRTNEHRTVRIQVGPDDTLGEVRARIQAIVDDWLSRYGADGRTGAYEIDSVY